MQANHSQQCRMMQSFANRRVDHALFREGLCDEDFGYPMSAAACFPRAPGSPGASLQKENSGAGPMRDSSRRMRTGSTSTYPLGSPGPSRPISPHRDTSPYRRPIAAERPGSVGSDYRRRVYSMPERL
jgi:hypothetical protein